MNAFDLNANPWVSELPVYEPGRPIEEVARELGIEEVAGIVKVASNENPFGPSPRALEAMRRAVSDMHRYPDGGTFYLRQALARHLDVAPGQLLPGTGSNELIELLGHVFLGPGTQVVVADRAFIVYRLVAAAARAEVIAVPMKDFVHDLDAMVQAVTPATRIVFIANPNNPTSTRVDAAALDAFMGAVPDRVIVCVDEAYIEMLPPEDRPDTLRYVREGRAVVLLRTFSKAHGLAGLRLGYAVAPEPCIALLNRVRQPFNVNAMAQAAGIAALEDEAHVAMTRERIAEGRAWLCRRFSELGFEVVPPCANFVLVNVARAASALGADPGTGGRAVFEALERKGIIARPMDVYGLPAYLRFTVGTPGENEACIAALAGLLEDR